MRITKSNILSTFIAFICSIQLFAQANNHLYYFINKKDSLVGVKDGKKNIIILPGYPNLRFEEHEKIPDNETLIIMEKASGNKDQTAWSAGDAFDRKGTFLFHPLLFDNGPDYLSEGTIRCVENGKVGFVNRAGEIIIKPQWEWASPFNYGYAFVCNGCYFDGTKDAEHPPMAFLPNHELYYINKSGNRVDVLKTANDTLRDYPTSDSGYLVYPFQYSSFEQKMVDSFNKLESLKHVVYSNYGCTSPQPYIHFELTERPSQAFPYYVIQGFQHFDDFIASNDEAIFLIDNKGRWLHFDYYQNKKAVFKNWLRQKKYWLEKDNH